MKKKLIIGLLVVACLVLFASCSNNIKSDNTVSDKPASWLLNKTWSGECVYTMGNVSKKQNVEFVFDDKSVIIGDLPEGFKISYATNGDKCEIKVTGSQTTEEMGTVEVAITMNVTRITDNECKLEGSETMTGSGISMNTTITGILKAK